MKGKKLRGVVVVVPGSRDAYPMVRVRDDHEPSKYSLYTFWGSNIKGTACMGAVVEFVDGYISERKGKVVKR